MYEITAYDGIVVLRRVGMNKSSIIDPPPGGVPIADLEPGAPLKYLPDALQFPDGTSEEKLRGWGTVLRRVAVWLYKNGHIKDASKSRLLNTKDVFHNSAELRTNLYVKLNFTAQDVLSETKNFLNDINHRPRDFKITLRPKLSGG